MILEDEWNHLSTNVRREIRELQDLAVRLLGERDSAREQVDSYREWADSVRGMIDDSGEVTVDGEAAYCWKWLRKRLDEDCKPGEVTCSVEVEMPAECMNCGASASGWDINGFGYCDECAKHHGDW